MRPLARHLVGSLVFLLIALPARATTPNQCGDADLSGTRTVTDGVLVLRTAAELASGCAVASRCDVDGNGQITVTDGVAALRLAAELPVTLACRDVVVDRSEFILFSFDRRAAFGFCPPLDSVSRVVLSAGPNGVTRSANVIVAGNPGDPDCLQEEITTVPPVECAREVTLPDRLLSADELARVQAVFAGITIEQQRHPDCSRITFDPCLINELVWDASPITDFFCGEPRLLPDQSAAIATVLDSLQ
jgi:hypothetical protein